MPKCTIDGKQIEFTPGTNLVEVAKQGGIEIPVFCYHKGMTVVAQCRMCAVEVEKMGKLQTACSTAAADGMVVHTKSPKVIQNQRSVMEFLLINHPLDCPICDKSGECDLQDQSFKYGDAYSRYTEERRTYLDLDMGPVIKKNMNRCIHCTRCIRFGAEIAGIREMVAVRRGNNTEITTVDGRPLETDYAGNYADICPTGSLTLKDFRFKKRAWFLKKTPTICDGCSRGCNMEAHQDNNVVHRTVPRENLDVNKFWLCDEGRFRFRDLQSKDRVIQPMVSGRVADLGSAIETARTVLAGGKVCVLVGTDLTQEELQLAQDFARTQLGGAPVFHFGTPGVRKVADDQAEDAILRRTSKTPNLFGAEKAGIAPFDALPGGTSAVLVISGGRAKLPALSNSRIVGVGVFDGRESSGFSAVLPGLGFVEKEGTFFNFEGREQKLKRAVSAPGESKALSEIFMRYINSKAQGVRSAEVTA